MLNKLTKKQVHSLLSMLDTLSYLEIAPGYTVNWLHRSRTVLDIHWNITREDPYAVYGVAIYARGVSQRIIIEITEGER